MRRFRELKLRHKLLALVLPLILVPIILTGAAVGFVAAKQSYQGITKASRDDLTHMADFAIDLLYAHDQQFNVYKSDKAALVRRDLATLTDFAFSLVKTQEEQRKAGLLTLGDAKARAAEALKRVNVGQTGYIYAMDTKGNLLVHLARQGENIYDEKDESGRFFIREMCALAPKAKPGEVLHIIYPWKNALLGDKTPRAKTVAYRYFPEWDWIIAAGSYLDETSEERGFEKRAFDELKARLKAKTVGKTGYIYALDSKGTAVIHPFREGNLLIDEADDGGRKFIAEILEKKEGWIRYPWRNEGEAAPRMKIVRYAYFKPWEWVVAVGTYEEEFFHDARSIETNILATIVLMTAASAAIATLLMLYASRLLTGPVERMTKVILNIKRGRISERMQVEGGDELGDLAQSFNKMSDILAHNRELEADLARQGRMASLGVLSSGVAHEINNPLGIILGYAAYLEKKLPPDDPNLKYVEEIHREAKRSKKIVQDLLSYARTPRPDPKPTDMNDLLSRIADFAKNHSDLANVEIATVFDPSLPIVHVDPDQVRQIAINLILNAGAAMNGSGTLSISTKALPGEKVQITFDDTGEGVSPEVAGKIFEPFFTTKSKGTGLGLAITRQLVESHQGEIRIENRPEGGARVTVVFPFVRQEF